MGEDSKISRRDALKRMGIADVDTYIEKHPYRKPDHCQSRHTHSHIIRLIGDKDRQLHDMDELY